MQLDPAGDSFRNKNQKSGRVQVSRHSEDSGDRSPIEVIHQDPGIKSKESGRRGGCRAKRVLNTVKHHCAKNCMGT